MVKSIQKRPGAVQNNGAGAPAVASPAESALAGVQRVLERSAPHRSGDIRSLLVAIGDYQCELEAQNEQLQLYQRELSESRDRYFELYELSPAGHVTLDDRGTIVEANRRFAMLLGSGRSAFVGTPFASYLREDSADRFHLALREVEREGRRVDVDLVIAQPGGGLRQVRLDVIPSESSLAGPQFRAVLNDVTELKEAEAHIRTLNIELASRIEELERSNRLLETENRQRVLLTEELERREQELRRLSRQVMTSQDDERRRLARELHDETGQALGALVAELRALEERHDAPELVAVAHRLRERVSGALRNVRQIAQGLHPTALVATGLVPALERLVADHRAHHQIQFDAQLDSFKVAKRPSPAVELTLFRVAQEALTNAVKHAQAHRVSLVLVTYGTRARLVVEDDGQGFALDHGVSPGLGLVGMRERVGLVGGEVQIESAPGRGTTIAVSIPLEPVDGSHPSDARR